MTLQMTFLLQHGSSPASHAVQAQRPAPAEYLPVRQPPCVTTPGTQRPYVPWATRRIGRLPTTRLASEQSRDRIQRHPLCPPAFPASPAAHSVQLPTPGSALYLPVPAQHRHAHTVRTPPPRPDHVRLQYGHACQPKAAAGSPASQAVQPLLSPAAAHSAAHVAQQMVHAFSDTQLSSRGPPEAKAEQSYEVAPSEKEAAASSAVQTT